MIADEVHSGLGSRVVGLERGGVGMVSYETERVRGGRWKVQAVDR